MADEEKKPEKLSSHVLVKVIGLVCSALDDSEVIFRIKKCKPLKMLMDMYCESRSIELNSIPFLFYGKCLKPDQTPDQVGMEDGDQIDAMSHQLGGSPA